MKPVSGFKTEDGNFFETDVEATYHEAETDLMVALGLLSPNMDTSQFIATVEQVAKPLKEYLNAYAAKSTLDQSNIAASNVNEAVQSFTGGSSSSVPDMGSSERTETVSRSVEGDGVGDGGHDASNVRSGEGVAVGVSAEASEARRDDGSTIVWEGSVAPVKNIPYRFKADE